MNRCKENQDMCNDINQKLFGQIIALFNNLIFNQTDNTIKRSISILNLPMMGFSEIHRMQAKEIWFTSKTEKYLKIIIKYLTILEDTRLLCKGIPKKELEELILSVISTEAFRCSYLSTDSIMFKHNITLIECRKINDKIEFAREYYKDILKLLHSKQTNWLNAIPLIKIKTESFELGYDGIVIVKRCDKEFWKIYIEKYPICINYDICSLNIQGQVTSLYSDLVVICKNYGSQKYAKLDAELKIKKFIAVLFSFVSVENSQSFLKSEYFEKSWCIQLPLGGKDNLIQGSYSQNLLPCYIRNYIEDIDIMEIKNYYMQIDSMSEEIKNRFSTATTFINHAMNSNNSTDIFLNYYISLDALFGVEFYVEKSIEAGIDFLISDIVLKNKAKLLYKLRNELVHGGSRFIEEWSEYERYYHKFNDNNILFDIEKIAFECLNKYPYKIDNIFFDEFIKKN